MTLTLFALEQFMHLRCIELLHQRTLFRKQKQQNPICIKSTDLLNIIWSHETHLGCSLNTSSEGSVETNQQSISGLLQRTLRHVGLFLQSFQSFSSQWTLKQPNESQKSHAMSQQANFVLCAILATIMIYSNILVTILTPL